MVEAQLPFAGDVLDQPVPLFVPIPLVDQDLGLSLSLGGSASSARAVPHLFEEEVHLPALPEHHSRHALVVFEVHGRTCSK